MDANKMPRMPAYLRRDLSHMTHMEMIAAVHAHGDACYLAGLAAAKEAVPERRTLNADDREWHRGNTCGYTRAVDETLANITALEKEAK